MKLAASITAALLAGGAIAQAEAATATFIVSSPYAQFSDSPFAAYAAGNSNFYLETFEDNALNTLGVTADRGFVVHNGPSIDSVDGDDGALDGNGNAGHSWYSSGASGSSSISFSFDANALGQLPTHVGIVWTDVGLAPTFGKDDILVRVFDKDGNSLGFTGGDGLGDGNVSGGSAEDRFFGAIFAGGISRLQIVSLSGSNDWEIDHLQYGSDAPAPVPVPGAVWLFGSALAGLAGLRGRRV